MKVLLVDLPQNEIEFIKKNCRKEYESGRILEIPSTEIFCFEEKDVLLISGSEELLSLAMEHKMATIAYQNPNGKRIYLDTDMIVEGFEEVDFKFLERIYQRHYRIPWKILETERLFVRELELSDMDALFELYSYEGMTEYMEDLYSYEEEYEYQKSYIEHMYRFFGYGMWLVFEKESGKLIGRAGIEHREELQGELELGYAIGTPYWGRSYATEVCQGILGYVREELGFPSVCALVEPENAVSVHLAEKLGFHLEEELCLDGVKYKKYRILF